MHLWLPLLIALALVPLSASAELVTVEFEAVVSEVLDDFDLFTALEPGSTVSGYYRYDADVLREPTTTPAVSVFRFDAVPAAGFHISAGNASFSLLNELGPITPLRISTVGSSLYVVGWRQASPVGLITAPPTTLDIVSQNVVGLRISGPDLFAGARTAFVPEISGLAGTTTEFRFSARREQLACPSKVECPAPSESRFSAQLTSLRLVPEPTAALLLLPFGLALIVLGRR